MTIFDRNTSPCAGCYGGASLKMLVFVVFLCAPLFAARHKLPDQVVETPVGNFRITNLDCFHGIGQMFVKGRLVNETSKSWDTVSLAMEFRDKNGVIKPAPAVLTKKDVGIGQTVKLDMYEGSAKADTGTLSVVFKFGGGSYPVRYRLALSKPAPSETLAFHDDALAISFGFGRTEIDFTLQNNTDDPIKIDWNLVSFVESWGSAQGVIHKGVKLADKQAAKPPTVIPPGAKIEDMVVPLDRIEFVEGTWLTHPLLFEGPDSLKMVGAEFSVFMPLEIRATIKNYTFAFKVIGAD